jgi:hypothetical protein
MRLYFYLLDERTFEESIRPALSASWKAQSFAPCRALCADLMSAAHEFQQQFHVSEQELLVPQIAMGLHFDRHFWRLLVGEILLVAAAEVPELQTAPDTLCCLLAPNQQTEADSDRRRRAPIRQVHFGSRDVAFGAAIYRPEHVGWNGAADVARLASYLAEIDTGAWQPEHLLPLTELSEAADREEELTYVREWFPALVEMYQRAEQRGEIIVCEVL